MSKKQIIIFLVAVSLIAVFVVIGFNKSETGVYIVPASTDQVPNPSQEIEKVVLNEKGDYFEIKTVYPKTNSETINLYFKNYVEEAVKQFKEDTAWAKDDNSISAQSVSLDIDYKNVASSSLVQNYIFSTYSYTGGAHGMNIRKTFSFNNQGQLLTISNLFKDGVNGITPFSKIVQKELSKRENAQADWILDGAGPKIENYQSFVVNDDGVTVLFDQYQVAPYSDGQIDIFVSNKEFSAIANPEIFTNSIR